MGRSCRARTRRHSWGFLAVIGLAVLLPGAATGEPPEPSSAAAGRLWIGDAALADQPAPVREARRARNRTNLAKAGLAAVGLVTWLAIARTRRRDAENAPSRGRDALLAALGVLGLLGWWNFGQFHYPGVAHPHELYHYVLGAKYFPELGYTRLYECTVVADAAAGLPERAARREITDLRTYTSVPAAPIVANPTRCTRHFAPERWQSFQHDVGWFRERVSPSEWEGMQRDHGYNPTPAWGVLGRALVGSDPLDDARIATLLWLDPLLLLLAFGVGAWAFGWRATSVALLFFGTNHPAEYGWVGGAYLRHDWFAASVAGLALLRRDRPLGGGFLIGCAAMLRVFPLLLFVPFALQALAQSWRAGRFVFPASHRRVAAGALLAAAVFAPLSVWSSGTDAWPAFAENIRMHAGAPTNTALGLGMLSGFAPTTREVALEGSTRDVDEAWKRAQQRHREARWPLRAAIALVVVALVFRASRAAPAWELALLGVALVPALVDVSCYYTAIFAAFGFAATGRPRVGAALCGLSLAGWLAAGRWIAWDDISTATSAALLLFVLGVTAAWPQSTPATER